VVAALITAGAYALAGLGRDAEIPANIGCRSSGIVLGLLVAAHVAVRRLAPDADGILLPLAALLNGIGYVFIVRLDEAQDEGGRLAGLQSMWTASGSPCVHRHPVVRPPEPETWSATGTRSPPSGSVLLLLPLSPASAAPSTAARIWVSIGPVNFQPGEFAKIVLALFFAGYLVERRELLALSTGASARSTSPTPSTSARSCWPGACRSPS
jgi:hypothetical protein